MFTMVIMDHLFLYFTFVFINIVLGDDVDESCMKVFSSEFLEEECCETVLDSMEDMDDNFEGCVADDDTEEAKCESMKCYLNNSGIWKDDEIDNEAAKKMLKDMELKYPKSKKVTQRISKQCLDDKYLNYGTDEVCPSMKYFICTYINTLLECDSWKKTDECSKNSEYASRCKTLLDSDQ